MNRSESKYFNTAIKMDLALISLLGKKSIEYISVSEICTLAGVNRSTFYLHYENIGELLDEAARYLLDDFLSYFSTDTRSVALGLRDCELKELMFISDRYLTPYLLYIKDRKRVFATALAHNKILGFENVYKQMFENIFDPILDRFGYPLNDRKYVMAYYLNGINAIILEWLREDCCREVGEIAKIISVCIYGRYGILTEKQD
ncbi:MAG: TetR/AcrR family transcriptional regulator [Clostridia bacterium]|nr:TetR/AcrR family transcriptional regulator [Clostridia bacterium]